jgi:hypothetical protein
VRNNKLTCCIVIRQLALFTSHIVRAPAANEITNRASWTILLALYRFPIRPAQRLHHTLESLEVAMRRRTIEHRKPYHWSRPRGLAALSVDQTHSNDVLGALEAIRFAMYQ